MSNEVIGLIYKLACLSLSGLSIFLGYRLFREGIYKGGAREIKMGEWAIKGGAPGIFFAICGAAIAGWTIYKGLSLDSAIFGGSPTSWYQGETETKAEHVATNEGMASMGIPSPAASAEAAENQRILEISANREPGDAHETVLAGAGPAQPAGSDASTSSAPLPGPWGHHTSVHGVVAGRPPDVGSQASSATELGTVRPPAGATPAQPK